MKLFGDILQQLSSLTPGALKNGLDLQRKKGGRLGEALVRLKTVSETEVLKGLALQLNMEFLPSLPADFSTEFTAKAPIHFLKKQKMVPITTATATYIAVHDPLLFQPQDDLRQLLGWPDAPAVLAPMEEILGAINYAYDVSRNSAEQFIEDIQAEDPEMIISEIEETADLLDDAGDAPVIKLVNMMFSQAVRAGASDIHIEPYQNKVKVRQRVDGVLYDMFTLPPHIHATLVSRIKIQAKLDIAEKRLPQDGRTEIRIGAKNVDVRVSSLPTSFGERVVMRLLEKSNVLLGLPDLGMSGERLAEFDTLIRAAHGIMLVTGPTGSGKTTTLYAALTTINSTDVNIITVEDPIEYRIEGIGQVQVNPKINLTFANGLRSIVRQDPDVILVGEIRDLETARIAIQSALTGHLVFSTLHTNNSASAVTRLIDMGIEPFLVTSSVNAVLAQRLVRKLCRSCCESYQPAAESLRNIGITAEMLAGKEIYRDKGCPACHHTGYKGRRGIFELLRFNDAIKSLILKTSDAHTIQQLAEKQGMVSLRRDGARLVLQGETTIEEIFRVTKQ